MFIVGIDLSGPTNVDDTALVSFQLQDARLHLHRSLLGASDEGILSSIDELSSQAEVALGIDAPLSYNPGGGDRTSDADLRRHIISAGLKPGSVMAPTMTRMVYLTLRGISIARLLCSLPRAPRIVEVHPGAAMTIRGASSDAVRQFKSSNAARLELLEWLEQQGLHGTTGAASPSDHYVAACAAALAAWKWHVQETAWVYRASPPFHPFDYAC